MKSKTKYLIDGNLISAIFQKAELGKIESFYPMGAGEFNAVYCVKTQSGDYVLKIAPRVDVKVLTYEKNMLAGELKWYERIKSGTSIKIPEIYYSDFSKTIVDSDYFIMEKLSGVQLDEFRIGDSNHDNATVKLAQSAAEIHRIKGDGYGYEQNGLFDDWYSAIKSMTGNLIEDARASGHSSRRGKKLLSYIERYRYVLSKADCRMVTFDLFAPNIICNKEPSGEVSYTWIDPERTFWGDRIADFVALEYGKPLREKSKSIQAYNEVSDEPIEITEDVEIRYNIVAAYLALIQEVEKYYRYSLFHFGWYRNVIGAKYLFDKSLGFLKKVDKKP